MSFNVATSGVGNGDAESGASLKIGTGRVEKSKGFPIRISTVKTYGHFKTEEEAIRLTRELKKLLAFTASIPQLSAWAGREANLAQNVAKERYSSRRGFTFGMLTHPFIGQKQEMFGNLLLFVWAFCFD